MRLRSNVCIFGGQQFESLRTVVINGFHAVGERVAGHVEIGSGIFRLGHNGHTKQIALLVVTTVGLQQIVHIHGPQSVGLPFLTVAIHLRSYLVVGPMHLVGLAQKEVEIHDGRTAVTPTLGRIVVGSPCTGRQAAVAVAGIVAHGIVGSHLAEREVPAGDARIAVPQYAFGIGSVLGHVVDAEVVLQSRLKHLVTRTERCERHCRNQKDFDILCFHVDRF